MLGREADAERLFEHLLSFRNDLGLLAEGVRPARQASARQLPAGLLARRPGQHRQQPDLAARTGAAAGRADEGAS
jgi:hypothetical protein